MLKSFITYRNLSTILLFGLISSCQQKVIKTVAAPPAPNPVTSPSSSSTTTSTTTSTNGGADQSSFFTLTATMRGQLDWMVGFCPSDISNCQNNSSNVSGYYVASLNGHFLPLKSSLISVFSSDSKFRVRVKVRPQPQIPQPINGTNATICYGRNTGSQMPSYTKLSFDVGIANIYQNGATFSTGGITNILNVTTPVSVNALSPILDFSQLREAASNIVGHAIQITNVKSDSECLYNGDTSSSCPLKAVVSRACWSVDIQLDTDLTRGF